MKEKKSWTKWIYWFVFAIAVISVYKMMDNFNDISLWFKRLNSILMPFFMGILIAYLLYIPCRKIEKCYKNSKPKIINKKSRLLSVITIYIIAILLIAIIINILIPALSKSIQELANNLPRILSKCNKSCKSNARRWNYKKAKHTGFDFRTSKN